MRKLLLFIAFTLFSLCASAEIRLHDAVDFLYRYMPPADRANYSESFFRNQARYALSARADMPWKVPDSLWLHFVLPPRVNNEELDLFRPQKYNELRQRVKGMSMRDAALEVNHWCNEHVVYRPSDMRTLSPLATLRNGHGRCGEQSVLAVAAMRAVGIPARQVYTPCWAHTDDNHAWIEVWIDGRWYFLGGCEPVPVLNMSWFNSSAARAMLMHTRVFGPWNGPEDVIQRDECFTEINCIANYVPTHVNTITVVDTEGRPVADALVEYKIYNYSDFCTVAAVRSDAEGRSSLTTGLGDILVWASKEGRFGYAKASGGDVRVVLSHAAGDALNEDLDMVPPPEGMIPIEVTDEQVAACNLRLAREAEMRLERQKDCDESRIEDCRFLRCDSEENALLAKSETNFPELAELMQDKKIPRQLTKTLLQNVSDKDLRDAKASTLRPYLENAPERRVDEALYGPYVLSPRIELEPLRPFVVPQNMRSLTAEQALAWTRDSIRIVSNPRSLRFAPQAVYDGRCADELSRNIFFVALCRTNGIPARIESVTGRTEYFADGAWKAVNFGEAEDTPTAVAEGTLRIDYEPTQLLPDLDYYRQFTLSRIDGGVAELLNYQEGDATEAGSQMSSARFAEGQPLAAGYYLATTGNRLSNGKVLAHIESFSVRPGETTALPMALRDAGADEITVKGYFNADPLLPQTGRGFYLLMLSGKYDEPTSHARVELDHIRPLLEQWGRPVLDLDGEANAALAAELRAAVNSPQQTLPIVVVADSFGRIVFYSEGYNTSLGSQLTHTIPHL